MVAADISNYIRNIPMFNHLGFEDFADKFNFTYTTIFLLIAASLISVKQYLMLAIVCYSKHLPYGGSFEQYAENYCWTHGTYHMGVHDKIDVQNDTLWKELEKNRMMYYQWVPFVLTVQCILIYTPRVLWQFFANCKTGTNLPHIINVAHEAVHARPEDRARGITHIVNILRSLTLPLREFQPNQTNDRTTPRTTFALVLSYAALKVLCLVNCLVQVYIIEGLLGFETFVFGITLFKNIAGGHSWQSTIVFPRATFCRVPVTDMANMVNYVLAQCVLPVNMLNEKIYLFLWLWVLVCFVATLLSVAIWAVRLCGHHFRHRFVHKYLMLAPGYEAQYVDQEDKFESLFLRYDGLFIMYMIMVNCGHVVCADIVREMFVLHRTGEGVVNRNTNENCEHGNHGLVNDGTYGGESCPDAEVHRRESVAMLELGPDKKEINY